MKKQLQWLLEVADKKPLLFSILLLLVAVGYLSDSLIKKEKALNLCINSKGNTQEYYDRKLDSIIGYYQMREMELNNEVKSTLNTIIADYKTRVEKQEALNTRITKTIKENRKIIKNRK